MKVYFRTDASIDIGTGHVMRCLTLAEELRSKGADVKFICRNHKGNCHQYIKQKGFFVFSLPDPIKITFKTDPNIKHSNWLGVNWETDVNQTKEIFNKYGTSDWLIIDHYAIDENWEKEIRSFVKKIMVIDDLADRPHDCDLLLDQNLVENWKTRYISLVPNYCKTLLGSKYAVLRPEFRIFREKVKVKKGHIHTIFISLGGTDPTNETAKAIKAIELLIQDNGSLTVDVVIGGTNLQKEQIKELCSSIPNVNYLLQVNNVASLMHKADIAIGAGGSTTWERCCLGLPSVVITVAENQRSLTKKVEELGGLIYLGEHTDVSAYDIYETLCRLFKEPETIRGMSERAMQLVDGKGIYRVMNMILHDEEGC
ncbi:UDP-2,4-diacetamido-2,4,6-trideoxy-beta-L-altropyranose hydrolase [Halalkalibacter lacteus]|uniref:UDP-2,4-diacetamido-2,4, 6-trideoxy-beta-L-altropyranose hydrolase n=1 Tax=Halalkalibacter lacteus TaxID=3090663 RepID=UPI002FCADF6E